MSFKLFALTQCFLNSSDIIVSFIVSGWQWRHKAGVNLNWLVNLYWHVFDAPKDAALRFDLFLWRRICPLHGTPLIAIYYVGRGSILLLFVNIPVTWRRRTSLHQYATQFSGQFDKLDGVCQRWLRSFRNRYFQRRFEQVNLVNFWEFSAARETRGAEKTQW